MGWHLGWTSGGVYWRDFAKTKVLIRGGSTLGDKA
jgi:hypothetical protein